MRFGDIGDEAARSADDADLPLDLAAVRADDDLIEALSAGLVPPPSGPRDPSDVEGELVALLAGWVADVRPESLLHPPGSLPAAVQVMRLPATPDEDEPLAAVGSPAPVRSLLEYEDAEPVAITPQQAVRHARLPAARRGRAGGGRAHRVGRGRALLRRASRRFAVGGRQGRLPGEVAVRRGGHRRQHRAQHRPRRAGERPHRRGAGGVPDRAGPARRRRRRRRPRRAGPPARLPHHAARRPRPRRGRAGASRPPRARRSRPARRAPRSRRAPPSRREPRRPSSCPRPRPRRASSPPRPATPRRRHRGPAAPPRRQRAAARPRPSWPRPPPTRCVRTARGQRARPVRCGLRVVRGIAAGRVAAACRPGHQPARGRAEPGAARSDLAARGPGHHPRRPRPSRPSTTARSGAATAPPTPPTTPPPIAPSDPPSGGSDDQSGGSDGAAANKSSDDSSQNSSDSSSGGGSRVGARRTGAVHRVGARTTPPAVRRAGARMAAPAAVRTAVRRARRAAAAGRLPAAGAEISVDGLAGSTLGAVTGVVASTDRTRLRPPLRRRSPCPRACRSPRPTARRRSGR